ncbi:MAG: hypothetical protein Q8764_02160 [Pigeon pea little leaf phytoplasma]|uniref:Uncharacterized protein n=1 Tax=Candidatus Phytoplasma fabacearum TaxID=2982628 RepID=A0ABU8ZV58_9MOLU|nr:hypothetical protein ['Bituminaria bituminosa' little leaf phytoplasma]MDV3148871.1 hypothetical protein [Pigeon pea little leaf phytoplasma]MDO7983779.1 hypothetical protein ['Bituminaria bituminosa' little leaf phytoplasma]MDO8024095.1 hypothetical protein ['Bituminaria bituminosa' little leaf phytoplasma]MDO8030800.1 hypothetical protein ['Bituminaria bituminosa' little leaf phytoplasma]MDV3154289.1 hypothetical protein [Pigeon pea little leaf phytoplasma]
MESRMLGNLLVRFGWGLFVIDIRKTNPIIETQIIYPYIKIYYLILIKNLF